jgi:hypothetical protein
MENKANRNLSGLNLDSVDWQISDTQLTYALNANIQSRDGNAYTYTNDTSTQLCIDFEEVRPGYKIIRILPILEQNRTIVFLQGPDGKSEIGQVTNNEENCLKSEDVETDCGCSGKFLASTVTPIKNTIAKCPESYVRNPITGNCEKTDFLQTTIDATTYGIAACDDADYGIKDPALYDAGYSSGGVGTYTSLSAAWWNKDPSDPTNVNLSYLNYIGIKPTTGYENDTWIKFRQTLCIAETKTYYLAIAADNNVRVNLDFVQILSFDVSVGSAFDLEHSSVDTDPGRALFQKLHIFPITLLAGNHTLEIEYINTGAPSAGNKLMFACEIYDNTAAEITAATAHTDLDKIFTTKDIRDSGEFVEAIYSCPEGYSLTTKEDCTVGCFATFTEPLEYVQTSTCCKYEPILTDDCCEDCCEDCYVYQYEADMANPGDQYDISWTNCDGQPVSYTVQGQPIFGTIGGAKKGTVKITNVVGSTPSLVSETRISECTGCDNPSPKNCCLTFSEDYPLYATYRVDQCETRIYFVAKNQKPRYLSLENPLNRDACGQRNDCNGQGYVTKKTCKELDIFPETCHPNIDVIATSSGGQLLSGMYHFSIAYTDEYGEEITDYFDFTRGFPVTEPGIHETDGYQTNQALTVKINHKDNVFDFFNLVVGQAVGQQFTYHVVGNYRKSDTNTVIFTGEVKGLLSQNLPLIRTPYYDKAGIIEHQNDMLMIADLEKEPDYNFQPLANKMKLYWETVKMPAGGKWDYSNPEIAYYFRTWQRDEVVAIGIKFKLKTGKYTEAFHIPGRRATTNDLSPISFENRDAFIPEGDCANPDKSIPKWKVYNTAGAAKAITVPANEATDIEKQYTCEITSHQRGEFGYYESTELYPCNEEIWDKDADGFTLADTPIRFHKFPDSAITHIHDGLQTPTGNLITLPFENQVNLYPIGIRVDRDVFNDLINNLDLIDPKTENKVRAKELICGFELVFGSRVGHKSVIAKGLVYDVGFFTNSKTKESVYYANYPFNDTGRRLNTSGVYVVPDPYLQTDPNWYNQDRSPKFDKDGNPKNKAAKKYDHYGFGTQAFYQHQRFTFHSPDTHFQAPKLGSELKLETLEMGQVLGHFVPVLDHSMTKFMTNFAGILSTAIGIAGGYILKSTLKTGTADSGTSREETFDPSGYVAVKKLVLDLIEQSVKKINYAWQYNGVAKYNSFLSIPNSGNKRRLLDQAAYLPSANVTFGTSDYSVANKLRESSVYLKMDNSIVQHYPERIDDSRYNAGTLGTKANVTEITRDKKTRAYYCAIKNPRLAQYGQLKDIRYVSTGYHVNVYQTSDPNVVLMENRYYPAFGGDTFITPFALKRKHAFFTQNLVGKADDFPFNYHYFPNLAFPTYYTGYDTRLIKSSELVALIIAAGVALGLIRAIKVTIFPNLAEATLSEKILGGLFVTLDVILSDFNGQCVLDNDEVDSLGFVQKGMMYLASYGIPIFYVESDVNTHFRHAINDKEGNFYPNVEGMVPDNWLQEKNVPIELDNTYYYDKTYSRQTTMNYSPSYDPRYPQLYCETDLYNRVIYSDPANKVRGGSQDADSQNRRAQTDKWLNFRRGNYYDFPKSNGRLIALNRIDNGKVYARFENTTKLYNAIITLDSTAPVLMEIGNASMFNQKPIDLATSDIGYVGTQHKAFVKIPQGGFWTDAKRGDIYLVGTGSFDEVSNRNSANWFNANLPFEILQDFPEINTDNPAKGLGITMVWDERLKKLLVTKLDYRIVEQYRGQVIYSNNKFYYNGAEIELGDPTYFENKSWTIGYSPLANQGKGAWISFYSFLPNHYVAFVNHFQSATKTAIWNHNLSSLSYQTYYGKFYPYILEYTVPTFPNTAIVNSVTILQDILKYYNENDYYSLGSNSRDNMVNFTKAILYNKEQTTGEINLVPQMINNAQQKLQYPRVQGGKYYALISKREHKYTFNGFFDMTSNKRSQQPLFSTKWEDVKASFPIDKVVNPDAVSVTMAQTKVKLRSTFCRVRLVQDKFNRYKFVNNLQVTQTHNSTI